MAAILQKLLFDVQVSQGLFDAASEVRLAKNLRTTVCEANKHVAGVIFGVFVFGVNPVVYFPSQAQEPLI